MVDVFFASYFVGLRNSFFDKLFCLTTEHFIMLFLFLGMCFLVFFKKRKLILSFLVTYFSFGILNVIIKVITERMRPFEVLNLGMVKCVNYDFGAWNSSFPSWHAGFVFLFIPFLKEIYGKKAYWFLVFAVFYSFVRIYIGVHYLSDILFGILFGWIFGVVGVKLGKKGFFSIQKYL